MSDKPFVPTPNKNVPQIGEPVADLGSLLTVTKSLKQGLESLGGYRGDMASRAVTFIDLVGLGLVPGTTFNMETGTGAGGVATVVNLDQEVAARKAGDQNLQVGLDTEEAERIAADADEATTRAAADGVLADDINTEEAARIAADGALQGEIDAEETTRAAVDVDLQNQINALAIPVVTFAGLPAGVVGRDAVVTDATVNTWGAAVTVGGGAMVVKVWWTGAAWTVLGRA